MNYQNLEAWKKGMEIVKQVYTITKNFPKEELYGITSQLRRASISIPSNVAEGIGRNYKKDTIQFLHISRGSLYELETILKIAEMIGLASEYEIHPILNLIEGEKKILNGLIRSFEERTDLK